MNYYDGNTHGNNGTKTAGQEKAERDAHRVALLRVASSNVVEVDDLKAREAIAAIIAILKLEA